jgi:hypothetical protein
VLLACVSGTCLPFIACETVISQKKTGTLLTEADLTDERVFWYTKPYSSSLCKNWDIISILNKKNIFPIISND